MYSNKISAFWIFFMYIHISLLFKEQGEANMISFTWNSSASSETLID